MMVAIEAKRQRGGCEHGQDRSRFEHVTHSRRWAGVVAMKTSMVYRLTTVSAPSPVAQHGLSPARRSPRRRSPRCVSADVRWSGHDIRARRGLRRGARGRRRGKPERPLQGANAGGTQEDEEIPLDNIAPDLNEATLRKTPTDGLKREILPRVRLVATNASGLPTDS